MALLHLRRVDVLQRTLMTSKQVLGHLAILGGYSFGAKWLVGRDHDGFWLLFWTLIVLACLTAHVVWLMLVGKRHARNDRPGMALAYHRTWITVLTTGLLCCVGVWCWAW